MSAAFVRCLRACRVALFGPPPCRHCWRETSVIQVFGIDWAGKQLGEYPHAIDRVLRCERCGDVKKIRT